MNDSSLHPLARDYLKRLKKAARRLPRARRKELAEEIEAHLQEALPGGTSETETLNALERLGEPEQIVAEAESRSSEESRDEGGVLEWIAIFALLSGVGWIIGVVLLWASRAWTAREKLIGTLLVPGGLLPAIFLFSRTGQTCSGGYEPATKNHPARSFEHCTPDITPFVRGLLILVLIALIVLPIVNAIYLSRRATRPAIATF